MSVKHGLLALLQREPMYGYQLRAAFDSATGGTWPLNIGQRGDRPRDEVAIKLALAITTPGVDVAKVVMTQRTATMRTLQEYTRLKTQPGDLPWLLVHDAMIFQGEAELRWLDHCEASLLRYEPKAVPETTDVEVPR